MVILGGWVFLMSEVPLYTAACFAEAGTGCVPEAGRFWGYNPV